MDMEAFFTNIESRPIGCHAPSGAPDPPEEFEGCWCGNCAHWAGGETGVCALTFSDHYYDYLRGMPHFLACERAARWTLENLRTADDEGCTSWHEG